ncbi:MAG TPA: ubiquinol-cytochrome C chaperone family protein [Novosphingobium sp.]|nr:ubiquinol-cytochrome C chaperone family protein [Novosphingobium sp.]
MSVTDQKSPSRPPLWERLFGARGDRHAGVRPLWYKVVEIAREKPWYAAHGIADTTTGRFDAITLVLALVLLRMESEEALKEPSVLLTELFVTDMDGQLREAGVGDMVVGKHIGRLMSVLGGRLGAYRESLALADDGALAQAVARNVTLVEGADAANVAAAMRALVATLAATPENALLAGEIAR